MKHLTQFIFSFNIAKLLNRQTHWKPRKKLFSFHARIQLKALADTLVFGRTFFYNVSTDVTAISQTAATLRLGNSSESHPHTSVPSSPSSSNRGPVDTLFLGFGGGRGGTLNRKIHCNIFILLLNQFSVFVWSIGV